MNCLIDKLLHRLLFFGLKSLQLSVFLLCSSFLFGQSSDFPCAIPDDPPSCKEGETIGCSYSSPPQQSSDHQCNAANEDLFVVKIYLHLVTDENGQGAQSWENINKHINRTIEKFAPLGILFSIEGWQYEPIPPSLYDYEGGETEFQQLIGYNSQPDRLDIYFFGAGIYDNGKANPIYNGNPACVIGDGISNSGVPFSETYILAHEIGHCLGLLHPEETACDASTCNSMPTFCECGDFITDTSPHKTDNVMNSGACSNCTKVFTEGQKRKMKFFLTSCQNLLPIVTTGPIQITSNLDIVFDIGSGPNNCLPGFVVEFGAKLTLIKNSSQQQQQSGLNMREDAKILVEIGGKLTIDAATIAGCSGDYWQGIEVQGNVGQSQLPISNLAQGYVRLRNGATIEKATIPLDVKGGGIVISENTGFLNCGCSYFDYYPKNNLSRFSNCDFIANSTFGLSSVGCNVSLFGVKNLAFKDCTFLPGSLPQGVSAHNAIEGIDAGFSVVNSRIEGYKEGIRARSVGIAPFAGLTVKQCTLKNNYISILNWNVDDAVIINNVFEGIGAYPSTAQKPRGIELRDCSGFTVKNNKFYGVLTPTRRIGIVAYNTGAEGNLINKNTFSGMYVANQAELVNRDLEFGIVGLQYHCNTNTSSNSYDFYVWDDGIAKSQGGGKATLNIFSHYNSNKGDFNNQSSLGINYYHDASLADTPQAGYYFGITPILSTESNDCDDDDDDPKKLTTQEEQEIVQEYNTAKSAYLLQRSAYLSLLDGGNTATLTATVTGATTVNRTTVYQQLLSISPYLTRSVLEAFANRDDIFSQSQLETVLSANPDELRNPPFQSFLQAEMGSTPAANILTHQHEVTVRTSAESLLGNLKTIMHQSANRIIHSELADTTGLNLPKIRTWLANKASQEADYALVETYLWEKDTIAARQVRDSISLKHFLTSGQLVEHNYYRQWTEIKIAAMRQGKNLAALDSVTVQQIRSIADNSTGLAATQTQSLLNVFYGFDYKIDPKIPNEGAQGLIVPPGTGDVTAQAVESQTIMAYPNPAKDMVTFEFSLPENTFDATLYVTNIHGNQVMVLPVTGQRGEVSLSVKDLSVGIYLYHLRYRGGKSQPFKLVLTK